MMAYTRVVHVWFKKYTVPFPKRQNRSVCTLILSSPAVLLFTNVSWTCKNSGSRDADQTAHVSKLSGLHYSHLAYTIFSVNTSLSSLLIGQPYKTDMYIVLPFYIYHFNVFKLNIFSDTIVMFL